MEKLLLLLLIFTGFLLHGTEIRPDFADAMEKNGTAEGIQGHAAVVGVAANRKVLERTYTKPSAYLNPRQGTVAFWLKPLDWDSSYTGMQTFFTARGDDGWLMIYKYPDYGIKSGASNRLLFLFGKPANNQYTIAQMNAPNDFKRNQWRFVAATWEGDRMTLYLDGKPVTTDTAKAVPEKPFNTITLGAASDRPGTTAIDELKIFTRLLTQTEIYQLYEASKPVKFSQVHAFTTGKVAAAPVLDGVIAPGEYSAGVTGMLEIDNKSRFAATQSDCFLAWDDRNLYVAMRTPADKLTAGGKDATVCWDDVIELFIAPQQKRDQIAHWIVNSVGTVYCERNQNDRWSAPNFRFQNRIAGGVWTWEAVIPFADLGTPPPQPGETWGINFCRTVTSPKVTYTSLGPSGGSYLAGILPVTFRDDIPSYEIQRKGNLNDNRIKLTIAGTAQLQARFADGGNVAGSEATGFGDTGTLQLNVRDGDRSLYAATWEFEPVAQGWYFMQYLFTDIAKQEVHVGTYQPQPLVEGKPTKGTLSLETPDGRVLAKTEFEGKTCDYENAVSFAGVKPGAYRLHIELFDHLGKLLWNWQDDYRIYPATPPPWVGNTLGKSDRVPAPWTPVEVAKDTVSVWGRSYRFAKGQLFPVEIISQGHEMLAAPIALVTDAGAIPGDTLEITRRNDTAATVRTTGGIPGLKVIVETTIEYDGFAWFTLTLTPETPMTVNRLAWQIPLKPEFARLRNLCDYKLQRTGATPAEKFTKNLLDEHPVFWLGSDSVGLQWVAENLKNYNLNAPERALTVTPGTAATVASVQIFDHPVTIDGIRAIQFGLEATPVRAIDRKQRGWRIWRNIRINFNDLFNFYSYPDPGRIDAKVEQERRNLEAGGCRVSPYMAVGAASPLSEEYKYYGDTWRLMPPPQGWDRIRPDRVDLPGVRDNPKWIHYRVCLNSASYRDFYLEKLVKAAKTMHLGGYYFDWAQVILCDNELHGCSWTDWNGQKRRTYGVLGMRDFTKRLWTAMKSEDPDFMIWLHMSGEPVMAVHAFADILLDGENLAGGVLQQESYYRLLPLDTFRAGYTSRNWGPQIFIDVQFTRVAGMYNPERMSYWNSPASLPPKKHLIGLVMAHDSMVHSCFGLDQSEEFAIMDRFGWNEKLEFLPYWEQQLVTVTGGGTRETVVSIYDRPERFMLLVLNNTPEERTLTLGINTGKLGVASDFTLKDEHTNVTYPVVSGSVAIPMAPWSFKMLTAKKRLP